MPLGWVGGGALPVRVAAPVIGPIDFADDKALLLALPRRARRSSASLVILVRSGTTGRFLDALRGSETAAASIGINPTRARIVAFALSAGIAGLGGGLLAMHDTAQAQLPADFTYFYSGSSGWCSSSPSASRTVEGAINAGDRLRARRREHPQARSA